MFQNWFLEKCWASPPPFFCSMVWWWLQGAKVSNKHRGWRDTRLNVPTIIVLLIDLWCQPILGQHLKIHVLLPTPGACQLLDKQGLCVYVCLSFCFAVFPFCQQHLLQWTDSLTNFYKKKCLTTAMCLQLTVQTAQLKRQLVKVNTNDLRTDI